jgi:drug/metabolite transporter (DMT)-like permease
MIFLIASIIVSTLFGISFKVISIKKINSFQVIIINYIVAGSLGFITTKSDVTPLTVFNQSWIWVAVGLGIVFIGSLFVIAETTSKYGISVAQVANRMSVVVPITIAILYYGDNLTIFKVIGIILAIAAVYLVSHKESATKTAQKFWWLFPLIIFICSGIIDSSINYAQRNLLNETDFDTN